MSGPRGASPGIGRTSAAPLRALVDGALSAARFREALARSGTPLVGPVEDGLCDVTFLVEDERPEPGASYRLRTLVQRAVTADHGFSAVPGTAFHALTLRCPADLRFGYGIERVRADGSVVAVGDPFSRRTTLRDPRLRGAVAVLPEARSLTVLDRAAERDVAPVVELTVPSAELGADRRVWVSPPTGDHPGPLPVVIVLDGYPEHSAPAVRDELLATGVIAPALVVLVDQAGRRDVDLTASLPFSRFLAFELLPLLRARYDVTADPAGVVLSGSSFGGLCAGWTALQFPDVVGGAILQSPSCWFHPDLTSGGEASETVLSAPTPTLIASFANAPAAPIKLFHEVGRLEFGPPPAQVWQTLGNRWLHGVLIAKGYDTVYREFAGGHDAAWWRGTWADAMQWMLPAPSDGRVAP